MSRAWDCGCAVSEPGDANDSCEQNEDGPNIKHQLSGDALEQFRCTAGCKWEPVLNRTQCGSLIKICADLEQPH